MSLNPPILERDELTPEWLAEQLRAEGFHVQMWNANALVLIQPERRRFVTINLLTEAALLECGVILSLSPDASELQRLRLLERLNTVVQMIRFSCPAPDAVCACAALDFSAGLHWPALLNLVERFELITWAGLAYLDEDQILESEVSLTVS